MPVCPGIEPPPSEAVEALRRLGLLAPSETATFVRLTGGVSSDIWKVETEAAGFCVKRALAKLKVTQDWRVPVARSRFEWDWICTARAIVPTAVPEPLGYDEQACLMALHYYDPGIYKLWKSELAGGRTDPTFAHRVGCAAAAIHAGTAGRQDVAARFPTDDIFYAIRLEPYLVAAARAHPDLAGPLMRLVETTAATKRALVHGDVSPKNILAGPEGPVFLDAECAWYGDPAFDPAFCLNHLLLKCLWVPRARIDLLACFQALASGYLAGVCWEPVRALEARIAHVLPGLLLARIDGKSPVEYVTEEADKDLVRRVARRFLLEPADRLAAIRDIWQRELPT
ncbi:MAG: phosphotransferase [Hyphomicrobiaceae bacterium]